MVSIVMKEVAAPSNVERIDNVSALGGQNTNTGTKATDIANALTGLGTNAWVSITYTDSNGTQQTQLKRTDAIATVL